MRRMALFFCFWAIISLEFRGEKLAMLADRTVVVVPLVCGDFEAQSCLEVSKAKGIIHLFLWFQKGEGI